MPQVGPEDPGPFSFASELRVKRVLGAAGFSEIALEPCDLTLDIAIGQGLDAAVQGASQIGPAARALTDQPSDIVAAATHSIREALTPHLKGNNVPLDAAIWIVTARA